MLLDVEEGAFVDVARNNISEQLGFPVIETQDTRRPQTTQAQLHLGTGVLTITSDEFIDLTPLSDLDVGVWTDDSLSFQPLTYRVLDLHVLRQ